MEKQTEIDTLAYSLAYEMAEEIVRSESRRFYGDDGELWFEVEPEGEVDLVDALRFLELRGLLVRHPENRNRVQVLDESEAA